MRPSAPPFLRAALPALAAVLLSGCSVLRVAEVAPRAAADDAKPDCIACFYLPYAVLAADVYRTRGAATERVQLVLNDDLLQRLPKNLNLTHDKAAALYQKARSEHCPEDQPAAARPPKAPKAPARPGCFVADAELLQEIADAGDEGFTDDVPTDDAHCVDGRDEKTRVPLSQVAQDAGWVRAREIEKYARARQWRIFVPDFAIEVWRRERQDDGARGRREYAIVFRGTAGSGGWFSNLRIVTALIPGFWDHYKQALASTRRIVEQIYMIELLQHAARDPAPGQLMQFPLVTLVGHSLGAGLARYAYLRIPEATRVVGFNPTPVDGGHTLVSYPERDELMAGRRQDPGAFPRGGGVREADGAPSLFFLHEVGEALTELAPCFPGPEWGAEGGPVAACHGVNLSHGSALRQHAMNMMACRLSLKNDEERRAAGQAARR